ncbi:MAG: hypothetical protein Q9216_005932 [Gyalolechia sp. 2 TL-2023]
MSGVQKFVVDRAKSSQNVASQSETERNQGVQAWMNHMGIDRPSIVSKTGPSTETERQASSRQAVADRSRVSTPVFKPRNIDNSRHAIQQPRAPFEAALPARNTDTAGRLAQRKSHGESRTLGAFETDTERLDDTTTSLDNSVDFKAKAESALEDTGHSRNIFLIPRTRQAAPKPRSEISSYPPASLASEDLADDDDDYDDTGQYEHFDSNDRQDPVNFRHEGAAIPLNDQGRIKEVALQQEQYSRVFDASSFPPNTPPSLVKPEFEGQSQSHPHHISSTGPPSISADGTKSEMENAGYLEPPSPDDVEIKPPIDSNADNSRLRNGNSYDSTPVKKRKHSPGLGSQEPKQDTQSPNARSHLSNQQNGDDGPQGSNRDQRASSSIRPQKDLDYEPKTLANMTYQQLADESFDTSPHPTHLTNPSLTTNESSLKDKLHYLHSLDGDPEEEIQSQRQAFFSSLPIAHYEECGDLMADEFSRLITRFKDARQRKRRLAREFEDEVAAREKVVEGRKGAVADDLGRLKRAGQDVVRR